ncbi:uncharacterized protein TNCV_3571011 [Trichonephila clavipes]|nr:uncharacterized protein TNCV_3571011 [Trichonephila clavipes]
MVKTHPLCSAAQKVISKFKPKFKGPYRVLEVKQNNLMVWRSGKRERITVNVDQVRLYHHRKSDEMEIRTRSSDNNSSSYKPNNFEGRQPRSNESQYSRKKGSGERRELEENGTGIKKDQSERHTGTASNRRPLVRSSPGSWIEPNRRTKKCRKETLGYKRSINSVSEGPDGKFKKCPRQLGAKRKFSVNSNDLAYLRKRVWREETVMPNTSGYSLRPRRGAKMESRPSSEKRTQQGRPVRSRGSREKQQYRPYVEEQRSSGRNTRSRSGHQHHYQERKRGAREQQHIPLPGGPSSRRQLQDIKIRLYGFIIHYSDRQPGELLQHESRILVL